MNRTRCGFTLPEAAIAGALGALLLGLLCSALLSASHAAARITDTCSCLRSSLLAMETIRRDIEQLAYMNPAADLSTLDGNRAIYIRVLKPTGRDLRSCFAAGVTYALRSVGEQGRPFHLIRADSNAVREIPEVLLADLRFDWTKNAAGDGGVLQVTVVGVGRTESDKTCVVSRRFHIRPIRRPARPAKGVRA
jgi:type II secretory pathway component PulJ